MLIAVPLLVLLYLVVETGYEYQDISAICVKCLQEADMYERSVHGVIIWRTLRLTEHASSIMSPSVFSPSTPRAAPELYKEIRGKRCRHVFKKGGAGSSAGLFLLPGLHRDGGYIVWAAYVPRIEAIAALYTAYSRVQDRTLSKQTYEMIDSAFPTDRDSEAVKARKVVRYLEDGRRTIEEFVVSDPKLDAVLKGSIWLKKITPELAAITTRERWKDFLAKAREGLEKVLLPEQIENSDQ